MKKTANLCVRIDPEIKKQAEDIFKELGIPVSTAINMFYRQVILLGGMPFDVSIPEEESKYIKLTEEEVKNLFVGSGGKPNQETINAILELSDMRSNRKKYKRYKTFRDILGDI